MSLCGVFRHLPNMVKYATSKYYKLLASNPYQHFSSHSTIKVTELSFFFFLHIFFCVFLINFTELIKQKIKKSNHINNVITRQISRLGLPYLYGCLRRCSSSFWLQCWMAHQYVSYYSSLILTLS